MIGAVPIICGLRCYAVAELLTGILHCIIPHCPCMLVMIVLAAFAFFFFEIPSDLGLSSIFVLLFSFVILTIKFLFYHSLVVNRYDDEYDYNLPII